MTNVQSMMNLLDMVYHTLTTRDCPTSEWRYYEGLRAMAQIAFPDFVISVDSAGAHYLDDPLPFC